MQATTSDPRHVAQRTVIEALVVASLLAALAWCAPARSSGPIAVGQLAPALVARGFDGQVIDLASFRGKLVVLNFWASWCGPCRAEMPALDALSRDYRDRGVIVVGLSADDRHDRKDAVAAARAVAYATGMLAEASTNGFGDPQVLPMTYIIGPDGRVSAILLANRGALSAAQLRAAVDAGLEGKSGH